MKAHTKSTTIFLESGVQPSFPLHVELMPLADLKLANHFLIAMPSMQDSMFAGSVVYLCEHDERGAMGVIINKPTEMTIETLLDRIDIKRSPTSELNQAAKQLVMFGGPVQDDRGFVLHAPKGNFTSTMEISNDVAFTTSRDVLEAVGQGRGPENILVSVGYAGWGAGQLEEEIIKNGWLTVEADPAVLFELPIEQRLAAAIQLLGFDPMMLSGEAGHA